VSERKTTQTLQLCALFFLSPWWNSQHRRKSACDTSISEFKAPSPILYVLIKAMRSARCMRLCPPGVFELFKMPFFVQFIIENLVTLQSSAASTVE
jgi:hypothetical protein